MAYLPVYLPSSHPAHMSTCAESVIRLYTHTHTHAHTSERSLTWVHKNGSESHTGTYNSQSSAKERKKRKKELKKASQKKIKQEVKTE